MENQNKTNKSDFHAVEFMRQVRAELSQEFLQDKKKYLDHLNKIMAEFKLNQKTS